MGTTLQKDYINNTFLFTSYNKNMPSENIEIKGVLIKGSCYTLPLLIPNNTDITSTMDIHALSEYGINKVDSSMERRLWHQRLNHCSDFYLNNAYLSIEGVSKFTHTCSIMDACPVCIAAKMKRKPTNKKILYSTTEPWEYIYMDCGFSGIRSKNDNTPMRADKGISGETCYLLIRDVNSGSIDGSCFVSKAIPCSWLNNWLQHHPCQATNKRCVLDQGGELFHNKKFVSILTSHGYDIFPTGAGAHHQAGFVECSHYFIGNGVRSLLTGANLPSSFWPYAFFHFIKIGNMLPQRKDN
jgi:hypothetical protein